METIEQALVELAAGRPVVLVGGEGRGDEGDLVVAADRISTATMAFVVRHTSGYVCVALPGTACARLSLPRAHTGRGDTSGPVFRVSVDAAHGIGTGISARDRAQTARLLAAPTTAPEDLTRPGHVVPLSTRAGGVLERRGHGEAAVDLTRLAGSAPAGVLGGIESTREPGRMAGRAELVGFATEHALAMITVDDLAAYRRATETTVERLADAQLPTDSGGGRLIGFRGRLDHAEHVAFVVGEPAGPDVPVHVHAECVIGDVFGARSCACARLLDRSLTAVVAAGRGVVVYARSGARPSLSEALAARQHHEAVADLSSIGPDPTRPCSTVDAAVVAAIMTDLGVTSVRHLHNTVTTADALDAAMGRVSTAAAPRRGRQDAPAPRADGAVA